MNLQQELMERFEMTARQADAVAETVQDWLQSPDVPMAMGVPLTDALPVEWLPCEALAVVKAMSLNDGRPRLAVRFSEGLTTWEALGMAQYVVASLQGELLGGEPE